MVAGGSNRYLLWFHLFSSPGHAIRPNFFTSYMRLQSRHMVDTQCPPYMLSIIYFMCLVHNTLILTDRVSLIRFIDPY